MKSNNDSSKTLKFIITVKFDQKLGGKNRTEDNLTDQNLFRLQFDFIFQQIRFQGLLVFVISKTKTGLRSQVLVFVTPAAVDLVLHTRKNSSDLIRTPLKLFFFFFLFTRTDEHRPAAARVSVVILFRGDLKCKHQF